MSVIKSNLPKGRAGECVQHKTWSVLGEYCLIKSNVTLQFDDVSGNTDNNQHKKHLWSHNLRANQPIFPNILNDLTENFGIRVTRNLNFTNT